MRCPVCDREVRGSNMRRHVDSRHPGEIEQLPFEVIKQIERALEDDATDEEIRRLLTD